MITTSNQIESYLQIYSMKEIKTNNVMSGWGKRTGDGKEEVGWEIFRLDTLLMCPRTEKVESILIIFKNCKYDFNIKI